MDPLQLAALIAAANSAPTGGADLAHYHGEIITWDDLSGVNSVKVNGAPIANLRVIQSGIGLTYRAGDVVMVEKRMSQWYILGKVGAPGAGAANQIASASVFDYHNVGTPTSWGDLPSSGPQVTVYIGSTRRCLVLVGCYIEGNRSLGHMSFQVSGASSIPPLAIRGARNGTTNDINVGCVSTRAAVLTADDGLNQGSNTFTAKYYVQLVGGTYAIFSDRNIAVIPF